MDDLLDKQTRELQDLGESTVEATWAEGSRCLRVPRPGRSPGWWGFVYEQAAFFPWNSPWFLLLCILLIHFKHKLNTSQ